MNAHTPTGANKPFALPKLYKFKLLQLPEGGDMAVPPRDHPRVKIIIPPSLRNAVFQNVGVSYRNSTSRENLPLYGRIGDVLVEL